MKTPKMIELTQDQIDDLLGRVQESLQPGDYELIKSIIDSFIYLKTAYENKTTSIKRLLRMLFGPSSEKKKKRTSGKKDEPKDETAQDHANEAGRADDQASADGTCDGRQPDSIPEPPGGGNDPDKKPGGHGRNGVDAFTNTPRQFVEHGVLKHGDPCPECNGKVYRKKPSPVIRFFGHPPIQPQIWELEKLRCNLCGVVFTAEAPEAAQGPKYDESAIAMMAMLRYGFGLPHIRQENLQNCMHVPLPASTQWDKVESGADRIYPAFNQLLITAAQGDVIHNDDTPMKVLELMKINENPEEDTDQRKAMQTTCILSVTGDQMIAVFYTGRNHAGDNFADLMKKRRPDRPPPIQMCDALANNYCKYPDVILAHCNSHARRRFVYESDNYPEQCDHVLDVFGVLYANDAFAKGHHMDDHQRLQYHQKHSGPLMESFHKWLDEQFEQKIVEPNSGMGQAISYMLKHWEALTRFLHVAGVPLDNNLCEQALKRAIVHRKNSLFYKTLHGAYIGDMYMSLIATCILNGINPFDYLVTLQRHSSEVFKQSEHWMPWNYEASAAGLSQSPPK